MSARLVFATSNAHKVSELEAILAPAWEGFEAGCVARMSDFDVASPVEDGVTFEENSLIKAHALARATGLAAIADDSGITVDVLGGAPGIFSARWAGPGKDFALAMKKVEQRLEEIASTDRRAWFTSALAVAWPDGPCVVVEGRIDGELVFPPRGDRGFGYDPIFRPEGSALTFGEMDPVEKDALSHRARAFARLKAALID